METTVVGGDYVEFESLGWILLNADLSDVPDSKKLAEGKRLIRALEDGDRDGINDSGHEIAKEIRKVIFHLTRENPPSYTDGSPYEESD